MSGPAFGAMTVVLGHWIGPGRVFATDVTEHALRQTREYVKKEGITNVTVIAGAEAATNLPDACCDAILLRNVYHHITAVDAFNRSLVASLKPGGRLAVIDLEDRSGGQIPKGVPANRGGHGIPPGTWSTNSRPRASRTSERPKNGRQGSRPFSRCSENRTAELRQYMSNPTVAPPNNQRIRSLLRRDARHQPHGPAAHKMRAKPIRHAIFLLAAISAACGTPDPELVFYSNDGHHFSARERRTIERYRSRRGHRGGSRSCRRLPIG